jgi:hypothetical protein
MKKSKQSNLSPENYIRQKARKLPLYEVWINSEWKDVGIAEIFISRKHANGNLTIGIYMVDIKCLGVKSSFYKFNVDESDFRQIIKMCKKDMDMELTDYSLVHNIIFEAIEYAEKYGFTPDSNFTSITKYILEDDEDESIELIPVHCGDENGNPIYIKGIDDSPLFINQTIKMLEENAGAGNFSVILNPEEELEEEPDFSVNEKDVNDFEVLKDIFSQSVYVDIAELSPEVFDDLSHLADLLYDKLSDKDKVEYYYEALRLDDDIELTDFYCSPELWGLPVDTEISAADGQLLLDIIENNDDDNPIMPMIEKLKKKFGDIAIVSYLELLEYNRNAEEIEDLAFARFWEEYPDYPFSKLDKIIQSIESPVELSDILRIDFHEIFGDRKRITPFELTMFFNARLTALIAYADIDALQAFTQCIMDYSSSKIKLQNIDMTIKQMRIYLLQALLVVIGEEEEENDDDNEFSSKAFQFKVQLQGITKPPVWRRLVIPANFTFYQFHQVIQTAFGWTGSHLYEFKESGNKWLSYTIGECFEKDLDGPDDDATEVKLHRVFKEERDSFIYTYDFGDDWKHRIVLEKIIDIGPGEPFCVDGKGACPPEDCGGVYEYLYIKKILSENPDSAEAKQYREWLGLKKGQSWEDVHTFDMKKTNEHLKYTMSGYKD